MVEELLTHRRRRRVDGLPSLLHAQSLRQPAFHVVGERRLVVTGEVQRQLDLEGDRPIAAGGRGVVVGDRGAVNR